MSLNRIEKVTSTAQLIGINGNVVECRIPPLEQGSVWRQFEKRGGSLPDGKFGYAARDGQEAVGNPTARDVIVPNPVDKEFLAYVKDMFGNTPSLNPVDLTNFTERTIRDIMERYNNAGRAVFYGWWETDALPVEYQLVSPDAQRWGNAKASLRQIYPQDVLAGQIVLEDPHSSSGGRTIYDITQDEVTQLKNGSEQVWIKASKWGLAGHGVRPGKTVDDILSFYTELKRSGVNDASIILEEDLPGEGGSFTLIRKVDGKVLFSHVTKQLNMEGRRVGNIIHSIDTASPKMHELIDLTAERMADSAKFGGKPGIYAYDTIEDTTGTPRPNDIANRSTGTWTAAYQRIHLINAFSLPGKDTVTMTDRLYLEPDTSFAHMIQALNAKKLTDFVGDRIVTIRQYYGGYGMPSVYLALTTTDQDKLPTIQQEVQAALSTAGINNSTRPLK